MKSSLLRLVVSIAVLSLFLMSCDQISDPKPTFGESIQRIPHLTEIPGADNVSITVNRNQTSSYFTLNLDNVFDNGIVGNGVYEAWCALWNAPINSNGEQYDGVKLLSTKDDPRWNPLNYFINNLHRYYDKYDALTWREVQLTIWDLLEYQNFDLESNQYFPEYDRELVYTLLEDVKSNSQSYTHQKGNYFAVFADMSNHITNGSNSQNLIFPVYDADLGNAKFGAMYLNGNNLTIRMGGSKSSSTSSPRANRFVSFEYIPGISPQSRQHQIKGRYNTTGSNISSNISNNSSQLPQVQNLTKALIIIEPGSGSTMSFTNILLNGEPVNALHVSAGGSQAWEIHPASIQDGFKLTGNLQYSGRFDGSMKLLIYD